MNDQRLPIRLLVIFLSIISLAAVARAQNNYENPGLRLRYVLPGNTMVELHSNFTAKGGEKMEDGVLPSNHAQHETLGNHARAQQLV